MSRSAILSSKFARAAGAALESGYKRFFSFGSSFGDMLSRDQLNERVRNIETIQGTFPFTQQTEQVLGEVLQNTPRQNSLVIAADHNHGNPCHVQSSISAALSSRAQKYYAETNNLFGDVVGALRVMTKNVFPYQNPMQVMDFNAMLSGTLSEKEIPLKELNDGELLSREESSDIELRVANRNVRWHDKILKDMRTGMSGIYYTMVGALHLDEMGRRYFGANAREGVDKLLLKSGVESVTSLHFVDAQTTTNFPNFLPANIPQVPGPRIISRDNSTHLFFTPLNSKMVDQHYCAMLYFREMIDAAGITEKAAQDKFTREALVNFAKKIEVLTVADCCRENQEEKAKALGLGDEFAWVKEVRAESAKYRNYLDYLVTGGLKKPEIAKSEAGVITAEIAQKFAEENQRNTDLKQQPSASPVITVQKESQQVAAEKVAKKDDSKGGGRGGESWGLFGGSSSGGYPF